MKAMILAAGLGTRLKPLTDKVPKALVEVEGVPILERVIIKLKEQGFNKIIVNVHHLASQIIAFLAAKDFEVEISISDESDILLDTGGGIVKAMPLLYKDDDSPVLIHNVDIISNANLKEIINVKDGYGATLLVNERESSRKLIFNKQMHLQGWHDLKNNVFRPEGFIQNEIYQELAFSGIYAMTKRGVEEMKKLMGEGKYSVMDYFLNDDRKLDILGKKQAELKILDIGKPATLLQASALLKDLDRDSN